MGLLLKLRRRKRDKNAKASSAASLLLPALPFNDDDELADLAEDKATTQTSNDSGYGSTENSSPALASTPAELAGSEEEPSQDLKFAQLASFEEDVVNRRRRESIRFELFGIDDDDDATDDEVEAREGESIRSAARPPPRPRLNLCTSVAGRRPPTAITPVSADSPQPQAYRPLPTWHSYSSTSRSTTTQSYFQPRYHTWASQRLLDITHDRIAASRRRSKTFPPGPAADGGGGGQTLLTPPSSTHAPAALRELRAHAPKDPLRLRLARSAMLIKLRNGVTSDEAGELYFGSTSRGPGSSKPPSYSVVASGSAPPSGHCPSLTTAPHPLALVLPRLPTWAHRPTYQERCVVTRLDRDNPQDEILGRREEEERPQGARPGSATVSSRVATFVAELAEHERLQTQFVPAIAVHTPTSLRPPRAPPPSSVPAQRAMSGSPPVSSLSTGAHYGTVIPQGAVGAPASPPAVVEDLLATSRTALIPARPSRPVRVRTCDDRSRPSSADNNFRNDDDDDDERPLAMLRRSGSTSCITERRQVDVELLGAQQVPLPFWLPPLISATATATANRTHSSTAWRPLSYAGSSARSGSRRGVVCAVPREEVAPVRPSKHEADHPTDTRSSPPVAPSVVVCTPAKARQLTSEPAPGSLYWPTTTTMAAKSLSFPPLERSRAREMPIATKRPDLRSRYSSIELHGSFKVIEHDFQFPSKSKRPWTRSLSLSKARSFWATGPDSRPACAV